MACPQCSGTGVHPATKIDVPENTAKTDATDYFDDHLNIEMQKAPRAAGQAPAVGQLSIKFG
jgi:hypothetical protein